MTFSQCESGAGICINDGARKACAPKCGDAAATTCAAGSSCNFLGVLTANSRAVGACRPDCGSGADACGGAGRVCDTVRRTCVDATCGGGCLSGATCTNGVCVPSSPKSIYGDCTPSTTTANGCASNLCAANGTTAGYCSVACNSDNGDTVCGVGGVCWGDSSRTLDRAQVSGDVTGAGLGQFATVGGRTGGICAKKCTTSADCPAGATCAEWNGTRACLLRSLPTATVPAAGTGTPGATCRADNQCASGACAKNTGYLDGMCKKATAAVCPANTADEGGDICGTVCSSSTDAACPAAQTCDALTYNDTICDTGTLCRGNLDCDTGYSCDAASAQCLTAPFAGTGAVGDPCTNGGNCAGGACRRMQVGYPSGYCSALCVVLPDRSDTCPSGAICAGMTGIGADYFCHDLCDASATVSKFGGCRTGYTCKPLTADPRFGICAPS